MAGRPWMASRLLASALVVALLFSALMNVGGRDGGAITAAQFLARFVKPETPWIHLDIAGTALVKSETSLAPKGATGWGVMALNRLIKDMLEPK